MPKYVASRSLTQTAWNATLLGPDPSSAIARLKDQPGKDLIKYGTSRFDNALLRDHLIDEFGFWIMPVVAGAGQRLFEDVDTSGLHDGDRLTPQGVADAEMIGRDRLHPPYAVFVSTGAARATQMLEILRQAAGLDDTPITAAPGLLSSAEDRWSEAARAAGKGADLDAMRAIDPDLVEQESVLLGSALRQVVQGLPEGGRALVVGHSPTNEAAVLGLVGRVVPPLG